MRGPLWSAVRWDRPTPSATSMWLHSLPAVSVRWIDQKRLYGLPDKPLETRAASSSEAASLYRCQPYGRLLPRCAASAGPLRLLPSCARILLRDRSSADICGHLPLLDGPSGLRPQFGILLF